jgi:hypothetical protein
MKTVIEVDDRKESKLIRQGLADPEVRAFVKVMGALSTSSGSGMKELVMKFAKVYFDEKQRIEQPLTPKSEAEVRESFDRA